MTTKVIIESLSMDLLRVALGLHRGSQAMAKKFEKEALNRSLELESFHPKNLYLQNLISKTKKTLRNNSPKKAEELLMYSVLFKNFAQSQYSPNEILS